MIAGPVVSTTVTVNAVEPELPAASDAAQVTVFVPRAKVLPDAGEQVAATSPSTASVAEAPYDVVAPSGPAASTVRSSGTVTAGAVVSTTLTSNDFWVVLPWSSTAVQFTAVCPGGTGSRRRGCSPP